MKLTHVRVLVEDFTGCFRFWGIRHLRDPAGTLIEINELIPMEEE